MFTSYHELQTALKKLPKNQQILFAADCARSVLNSFENKYPNDLRPRKAIEMAESFQYDKAIADAAYADAAAHAASYATYAAHAASSAAYTTAEAARISTQIKIINYGIELLRT